MLIDWFTVGAQIVNFLILVWLLRRFLYGPVLRAMDERQQRLAAQVRDAEQRESAAAQIEQRVANDRATLEHEREQLLVQASDDAATLRRRLTEEARTEVEGLRKKWSDALEAERHQSRAALARAIHAETLALARDLLGKLAGQDLERAIVDRFIAQLRALEPAQRAAMASLVTAEQPLCVRTAFELTSTPQQALDATIRELLGTAQPCRFERSDDVVCGVELSGCGYKVAWSVADALASIDDGVRALDLGALGR